MSYIGQTPQYAVRMTQIENTGEYLPKYDVYIQYLPLPNSVDGAVTTIRCESVIFVNMERSNFEKLVAITHEIRHILFGDLERDGSICDIEDTKFYVALFLQSGREALVS